MQSKDSVTETLLTFPCLFPIKIMGLNDKDLVPQIIAIIASQVTCFNPECDVIIKPSSKGNYIAITANIMATSKDQLDTIYRELNSHHLVKVTL